MTVQITVRIPNDLGQFVKERAETLHETSTAVVVAALKAEQRRIDVEHEIEILTKYPYTEDEMFVQTPEQLTEVLKDLD
jgi:hypothetical protein